MNQEVETTAENADVAATDNAETANEENNEEAAATDENAAE